MANMTLIKSIIIYLKEQCKKEKCPDTRESLEVAVQCLQTAYDIDSKDPSLNKNDYDLHLEDIFNCAINAIEIPKSKFVHDEDLTDPSIPKIKSVYPCSGGEEEDNYIKSEGRVKKAEMMKNLGNNFMRKNQFSEAIRYYTAAIELDSSDAVYYGNRAAAYSKIDDFKNAIKDCETAVQMEPYYAKAYGRMGLAYTSLHQYDKAIEAFTKAVELEPENESYQSNLKLTMDKKAGRENKPTSSRPGLGGLNIDWGNLFSDPAFRNMASTLMQDQTILNALSAGMNSSLNQGASSTAEGGATSSNSPGSSFDMLLEAGQLLASQMQASNPDLIEQFRSATRNPNPDNNDPQ